MTVLLILFFLFFITASVTDIHTGKVRNKDILIFLFLGTLYYAVFLAKGLAAQDPATIPELKTVGINLLIAFAVSFAVRSAGIWPAGDAKSFVVANLLLPTISYKHIYFTYFPGFTLLVNVFMIGVVYIVFKSGGVFFKTTVPTATLGGIIAAVKKGAGQLIDGWASYLKLFSSYMIVFFAMNIITQAILLRAGVVERVAPEVFMVALFFIMKSVGGFVNNTLKAANHFQLYVGFVFALFYLSGWSYDKSLAMLANITVNAMKFMAFYGMIRVVVDYYINRAQVIPIELTALKAGDLPTREFLGSVSAETREQLRLAPEGLSAEEAEAIKNDVAKSKADPAAPATIYEPIPFVPIMFAGALFTVVTGVSSVQYIKILLFK